MQWQHGVHAAAGLFAAALPWMHVQVCEWLANKNLQAVDRGAMLLLLLLCLKSIFLRSEQLFL